MTGMRYKITTTILRNKDLKMRQVACGLRSPQRILQVKQVIGLENDFFKHFSKCPHSGYMNFISLN